VWIFTKQGFVSIKQHKDDPKKLIVRGRVEGDLEKIFPGCKVTKGGGTDYLFRATVPRVRVAGKIADDIKGISYTSGFKTSVDDHQRRSPFYLRVWEVMTDLQDALSRKRRTTRVNTNSQLEKDIKTA
jgi:hypothetical protein